VNASQVETMRPGTHTGGEIAEPRPAPIGA